MGAQRGRRLQSRQRRGIAKRKALAVTSFLSENLNNPKVIPEKIVVCDRFGNVSFKQRIDSTLKVPRDFEPMHTRIKALHPWELNHTVGGKLVKLSNKKAKKRPLDWGKNTDLSVVKGVLVTENTHEAYRIPPEKTHEQETASLIRKIYAPPRDAETVMVKVGVIAPHKVLLTDKETGEKKLIRVPAKDRFLPVGLHGSVPNTQKGEKQ